MSRRSRSIAAVVLGATIGLLALELSIGFELCNPQRTDWLFVGLDPSTHFLGWHMFRNESWTWPLGAIRSFGHPIGTSVALTDSIPLIAIPLKTLDGVLSTDFQYLGLWLGASFVLQGAVGALLVARATPHLLLQVFGAALFVLTPMLLHRLDHAALTAHWMLLAGLWLYWSPETGSPRWQLIASWTALVAVVSATHPYLAAMVLSLAAAAFTRTALLNPRRMITASVLPVALLLITAAAVAWQCGYFVVGDSSNLESAGLGEFSLNLLAPVMPLHGSWIFGAGPFTLISDSQYEGYAYAGAGVLALALVALISTTRRIRSLDLRPWLVTWGPLALVCAGLTLFALSPRVTASSQTLFEYDGEWFGPLTVFRVSGRMFWPVYYTLLFAIVVTIVKRFRFSVAVALMVGAVALQAADISTLFRYNYERRSMHWLQPLASAFWDAALPSYAHVVLRPTNICSTPSIDFRIFALPAGRYGNTINGANAARYDVVRTAQYCATFEAEGRTGRVSDDELYVMFPRLAPLFQSTAQQPVACSLIDGYAVCFTAASYSRWQDVFDITRQALPPDDELRAFRNALEAEYRDRMRRPSTAMPGTMESRLSATADYLGFRVKGCGHDEASSLVAARLRAAPTPRLCRGHRLDAGPLPPPQDTLAFRRSLDQINAGAAVTVSDTSHVDVEGEAVWVHDYLAERLGGHDHAAATAAVVTKIRAIVAGAP